MSTLSGWSSLMNHPAAMNASESGFQYLARRRLATLTRNGPQRPFRASPGPPGAPWRAPRGSRIWRERGRPVAARLFWTAVTLVPVVGLIAYAAWRDPPPPPKDPTDRRRESKLDEYSD